MTFHEATHEKTLTPAAVPEPAPALSPAASAEVSKLTYPAPRLSHLRALAGLSTQQLAVAAGANWGRLIAAEQGNYASQLPANELTGLCGVVGWRPSMLADGRINTEAIDRELLHVLVNADGSVYQPSKPPVATPAELAVSAAELRFASIALENAARAEITRRQAAVDEATKLAQDIVMMPADAFAELAKLARSLGFFEPITAAGAALLAAAAELSTASDFAAAVAEAIDAELERG